jgi:hypothetical protein
MIRSSTVTNERIREGREAWEEREEGMGAWGQRLELESTKVCLYLPDEKSA